MTMPESPSAPLPDQPAAVSGAQTVVCLLSRRWQRGSLIVLGWMFVALALAGAALPLLPTTPFLLLAAACFARSSSRFYYWLHSNRLFGDLLSRYRRGEGIPLRARIVALIMLWASLGYSAVFAIPVGWWPLQLVLVGLGLAVSLHLCRMERPLVSLPASQCKEN